MNTNMIINSSRYKIDSVHGRFTVFVKPTSPNAMFQQSHFIVLDNDDATVICEGSDLMKLWIEAVHKTKVKWDHLDAERAPALIDGAL